MADEFGYHDGQDGDDGQAHQAQPDAATVQGLAAGANLSEVRRSPGPLGFARWIRRKQVPPPRSVPADWPAVRAQHPRGVLDVRTGPPSGRPGRTVP